MKIGVIVPVYNVEKYIAECIDSILAQTYTNFRLILVDDGTPDNAGKICDEYAKRDHRITVVHQENSGVTRARERGVEEASDCEFITFVDGDDTIIPNALELFINTMNQDCDIVISHFKGYKYPEKKSISIQDYRYYIISASVISCGPCSKLYRRTLFNHNCFDIPKEIKLGEDLLMNVLISFHTQKDIVILTKEIYNYRSNDHSATKSFNKSLEYEIIFHKELTRILSKHNNIKYTYAHIERRLTTWNNTFGYSYTAPGWYGTNYHKEIISDIKDYRYPIRLIELLLLEHDNRFIRFVLINIRRLRNLIWRF